MKLHRAAVLCLCLSSGLLLASCVIAVGDSGAHFSSLAGVHVIDSGPIHRGSGTLAVEERTPLPFTGVVMQGSLDVEVTVDATLTGPALEIEGEDNLLAYVRTEVHDGMLVIALEDGSYYRTKPLVVRAWTPRLAAVELEGSGDVHVSGLDGASFRVRLDGSGDVSAEGRTDELVASLSGSGDLDLGRLSAGAAQVELEGSGDIRVAAKDALDVTLDGSGDIGYKGQPQLRVQSSGSGELYSFD